ncbi:uric acid degradation bifunctional protein TTL-like [Arachis ipaensis]|uniref:uric acid degradation bifunctional protein TTL-like n=1 Tax=Arachis ipaensis TaxID=130454 RepID=UPI0007AF5288|nr:uric acid degradation bifunctional protein TTL-like [Arachis ipaensis]
MPEFDVEGLRLTRDGKLECRDFYLICSSRCFGEKMIKASPFYSLDDATSFARKLWFNESSIQSWLDAFSGRRHLTQAIGHAPGSMMKELNQWDRMYWAKFGFQFITSTDTWCSQEILDEVKSRHENSLVVELEIAAREEFNLIVHGLDRLWDRMSRENIQKESEAPGEVVPDSLDGEDVVPSDRSDGEDADGPKASTLSYDLNLTPEENEDPYSGMSPEKRNAWHLAVWATRYLNP